MHLRSSTRYCISEINPAQTTPANTNAARLNKTGPAALRTRFCLRTEMMSAPANNEAANAGIQEFPGDR